MKKLTPEQEQKMDDTAEALIMLLCVGLLLVCALIFVTYFPAIAPAVESFMQSVRTYGGYGV